MTEIVRDQQMTHDQIAKGKALAERVFKNVNHVSEADDFTKSLLEFIANVGAERGLSQEQQVFAIAVATVHLRETFPGGKARFDELAHAAHMHYVTDDV